jgi:GNAT superfamily N-acetyltransferase
VAEVDGQIVGTGTLGRHEGTPVIWKIYVLPGGQRQGVGSALMRQLLATALPSEDVLIEFVSNNAVSRTFYERFGFAPDHEDTKNEHITTTWYRRPAKSR